MLALDLFSGLGGWSIPFKERGHSVVTLDIDPGFGPDIVADILEVDLSDLPRPDVILASPPCEAFSVLRIGKNWTGPTDVPAHSPKTLEATRALKIVHRTLWIIDKLQPQYWVMENPRAKLRKMPAMAQFERRTVTYCQYGEKFMKPTDLWGGFPASLQLLPPCQNGADCHVRAPRGSTTGIQGYKTSAERAKIPYLLALDVCKAMEIDVV